MHSQLFLIRLADYWIGMTDCASSRTQDFNSTDNLMDYLRLLHPCEKEERWEGKVKPEALKVHYMPVQEYHLGTY